MAESSHSAIALGCSVAIVSSAIQAFGVALQRKSHLLTHEPFSQGISVGATGGGCCHDAQPHSQKYRRNMWYLGFGLFIVANVLGSVAQMSTLPLIILSPLQSIGLIFNSMFSCLMLPGDQFSRKLWIGTAVIACGAFIIANNGAVEPLPEQQPPLSTDDKFRQVISQLLDPFFAAWFVSTFAVMGCLLLLNKIYLNRKISETHQRRQKYSIRNGNQDVLLVKFNKFQFWKGINYGVISGTLTAHTFLFAKSIIDVIIESIMNKKNGAKDIFSFTDAAPWLLLVSMLSIVALQLTAFNLGLAEITTAVLYPLCFLVYNLVNLINDLNFNKLLSDHRISYLQLAWILIGLLAVLCGVVLLSWDTPSQQENYKTMAASHRHGALADEELGNGMIKLRNSFDRHMIKHDPASERTALIDNGSSGNSLDSITYSASSSDFDCENRSISVHEEALFEETEATDEMDTTTVAGSNDNNNNNNTTTNLTGGSSRRERSLTFEQNQLLTSFDILKS
ncbi:uncharacterized protein LODBEIA_P01260 [Lodderomyces beijingensis]|uniref:Magnesium transporter n=1 Tax=Lodderomyces beijingensis TaxID=1775926 RepID=A0ABP0ZEK8_9ASCO